MFRDKEVLTDRNFIIGIIIGILITFIMIGFRYNSSNQNDNNLNEPIIDNNNTSAIIRSTQVIIILFYYIYDIQVIIIYFAYQEEFNTPQLTPCIEGNI